MPTGGAGLLRVKVDTDVVKAYVSRRVGEVQPIDSDQVIVYLPAKLAPLISWTR